jgi:ribosomal protein L37AE/L43A/transposase-like protein
VEHYRQTLPEFEARFGSEEACRAYLAHARWPDGFRCPRCGATTAWRVRTVLWQCADCGRQTSVTAGTLFHDTRTPLTTWFRAIWCVTSARNGVSARELREVLGLGSYQTAWAWLHKLRRAMVRPGRDRLSGRVEVGESHVRGVGVGRGGSTAGRTLVVIAAEEAGRSIGRIRMRRVPDGSAATLLAFVQDAVAPGTPVDTNGWAGYDGLTSIGYPRRVTRLRGDHELASGLLPRVTRIVSLLERWLVGTHQGAVSAPHLDYYLDEFTFRFNRRASRRRGALFFRLLEQAAAVEPVPYVRLVDQARPRALRHQARLGRLDRGDEPARRAVHPAPVLPRRHLRPS